MRVFSLFYKENLFTKYIKYFDKLQVDSIKNKKKQQQQQQQKSLEQKPNNCQWNVDWHKIFVNNYYRDWWIEVETCGLHESKILTFPLIHGKNRQLPFKITPHIGLDHQQMPFRFELSGLVDPH